MMLTLALSHQMRIFKKYLFSNSPRILQQTPAIIVFLLNSLIRQVHPKKGPDGGGRRPPTPAAPRQRRDLINHISDATDHVPLRHGKFYEIPRRARQLRNPRRPSLPLGGCIF
ncbi:hypothetical protein EVAR_96890_1 [Eumeta japonica]|uniref:Uncharacterized protein n=1 Tax=Eumeta variegata TaxID=151549 RepID=A0A4C1WES2_EUMVA|nr:hypothetical protein EVAR_96890_1 [Eumeta japonica]